MRRVAEVVQAGDLTFLREGRRRWQVIPERVDVGHALTGRNPDRLNPWLE
jgi:hypothetical protein